jgi:hypothetical protein
MTEKSPAYVGIDPGKAGAIVALIVQDDGVKIERFVTPILPDDEIDVYTFLTILGNLKTKYNIEHACVEKVHGLYGASAASTFSFGESFGIARTAVAGLSNTLVPPKTWQKEMWAGVDVIKKKGKTSTDTKAMSLVAASRLFPTLDLRDPNKPKARTPHDGIVDALLIAEYCRRSHGGIRTKG